MVWMDFRWFDSTYYLILQIDVSNTLLLESLVNPILVVDSKAEVQSAAHKGV